VPLTPFQQRLLADLAQGPDAGRYLAGGAAMHFAPNSERYSESLDFFHDSEGRVAAAFAADHRHLEAARYTLTVEFALPGMIRAMVRRDGDATRIDWAHDSAWRFMPLIRDPIGGLLLHPVDLAINKTLALAGRDEPRDFVDMLFAHRTILPLAGMAWAAVGKDPGFTPLALLELLKRRGHYRPEDFTRLSLAAPFDLAAAKEIWLDALVRAETFVRERPADELGCLYYAVREERFVVPDSRRPLVEQGIVAHHGTPGGVVPRLVHSDLATGAD
jgi:hypothetical protein